MPGAGCSTVRPQPQTAQNPLDATDAHARELQALQEALRRLLLPMAQLGVARGLPYAAVEELFKQAYVQAAGDAHPGLLPHRKVSRISTVTGINRREVTRLTQAAQPAPRGRSVAAELFAHWLSDRRYRDADGHPLTLPRQGAAPSFEALAQEVTRDVHPRSLLDELLRLQLAQFDEAADTVTAARDAVPRGDQARMLAVLGSNVGQHLQAAVDNVLDGQGRHFEQALYADGLSAQTLDWLRGQVRAHWQDLRERIVPELERRIEADGRLDPPPAHQWRVGLYTFNDAPAPATAAALPALPARRRLPKATP